MNADEPWAMADPSVREARLARIREPHIAPITQFVERLRERRAEPIPYVDPDTGGTDARILFVLLRPGKRAVESGFLSINNHDLTARYSLELLAEAGIPTGGMTVWNIVPWYAPRRQKATRGDIAEGAGCLNELLRLLPALRSLVLVGREAQSAAPLLDLPSGVRAFQAPHPSPSNLHTDPRQRGIILGVYRQAWTHAMGQNVPDAAPAPDDSLHSSLREKVLEHVFVGDLLRTLWRGGMRDIEVLRAEVDSGGYGLVIGCKGVLRHIQLKASHHAAATETQKVNVELASKPSGCVVWMRFDQETMQLGPFLWFGGAPGEPLPPLGDRIAKHTKGDRDGIKAERPNIRVLVRSQFRVLPTMDDLVRALFGG